MTKIYTTLEKITPEIVKELIEKGVDLNATQKRVSIPVINRIYLKMVHGIKFRDINVTEDYICNGHHRYIASLLAKIQIGRSGGSTALADIVNWKSVILETDDWDTEDEIKMFNELDAKHNPIEYEKVAHLLNL